MSVWPEPDAALVAFVGERQRIAISNYVNDPLLLQEHLGHEEDLASGGYGKRQIPELLQNAADALLSGGSAGRVEFRIAGGNLYCANEGAAFDERGVTALCYAFIASKRGDEIGRFGLGFKSVLALTDNPQVFSRTVSFQFNAPGSQSIFIGAGVEGDRFPVMRVPAVIDAHSEAASDPDLADLMTWASTIVKLPLARGGARVREELVNLPPNYLLFLDWVNELGIVLAGAEGQREPRRYLRQRDADDVTITNGDEVRRYAYASRMVRPSAQALAELPSTIARDEMLVSYAAHTGRQDGRAGPPVGVVPPRRLHDRPRCIQCAVASHRGSHRPGPGHERAESRAAGSLR